MPTVTPPKRQTRSTETRRRLVEAGLVEFAAHGFDGASTRAIAERAGVHQPQIIYHFAGKDELWHAVLTHLFDELDGSIGDALALDGSEPLAARFATGIRRLIETSAALPELNRIMVHESTRTSPRLQWIVDHLVRPRFELFSRAWNALRAEGEVADIEPIVAYYSVVGAASLLYTNAAEGRLLLDADHLAGADRRRLHDQHIRLVLTMIGLERYAPMVDRDLPDERELPDDKENR